MKRKEDLESLQLALLLSHGAPKVFPGKLENDRRNPVDLEQNILLRKVARP